MHSKFIDLVSQLTRQYVNRISFTTLGLNNNSMKHSMVHRKWNASGLLRVDNEQIRFPTRTKIFKCNFGHPKDRKSKLIRKINEIRLNHQEMNQTQWNQEISKEQSKRTLKRNKTKNKREKKIKRELIQRRMFNWDSKQNWINRK